MTGDFADEGSRLEELAREDALQRHRERNGNGMPHVQGSGDVVQMNCIECGELIPTRRMQLNPRTRRCTDCASEVERRG